MTEVPDTDALNAFNKSIIDEFRTNGGTVSGQFANADLLLLSTTGAKSGRSRVSPLAYFRIDGKLIIIGSFAGLPVSPAWVHNLRANPQARVEIGTDEFAVTARELPTEERDAVFDKVTAASPGFAEYQSKTSLFIPLFELQRT
jgi:deazaflavin-dependent oxidoreductase (nitroreductase family)